MTRKEYIGTEKRIFDIYSGILFNYQEFAGSGEAAEITYDFDCPEYKTLIEKYGIDKIAGKGSAFQRAKRLLHWMAPKLKHESYYDNHVPCNALDLLAYSLNQPEHGINCLNKAKILTECCLAVGIYARRVLILPFSPYDSDNHVVTEIYDGDMGKWIMLDPSTDGYFINEEKTPLSALELREHFAQYRFAAFTTCTSRQKDLHKLFDAYAWTNTYFCKNMFHFRADSYSGFGRKGPMLSFIPQGFDVRANRVANWNYRIQTFREEFEAMPEEERQKIEQQREEARTAPAPVPVDIALLAAPPQ